MTVTVAAASPGPSDPPGPEVGDAPPSTGTTEYEALGRSASGCDLSDLDNGNAEEVEENEVTASSIKVDMLTRIMNYERCSAR